MQLPANRKLDKYLGYCLIAILLPVTRLLGILLRRNRWKQQPPQHLLFIKLLGLGSLVVASEAIAAMRKKFPDARFILITDLNIANGIAPFHVFDEVWAIDTGDLFTTCSSALRFLIRSWQLHRLWVADLEVYSKLTTVYALLTMARNRFGFHLRPVFFRKYLNTHNIPFQQNIYLEDNYYHMARAITGMQDLPTPARIQRNDEWQKPYIIVNNTCSSLAEVRKLPDATFAAICTWILEHTPYQLAFLGTSKDKPAIDDFIDAHIGKYKQKGKIINTAGALDFEAYYHFISDKGVCMITIDSAPLHIARKLGLPTVSIWGPTNPAHYLKIHAGETKRHLYHYGKTSCSPCVHHYEQLPCGGNNTCMLHTTAESIIEQIKVVLHQLQQQPEQAHFATYKNQHPCSYQKDIQ